MDRKKILFIIPWLPYPLVSGGHQAIFNGILSVKDEYDIYITYPVLKQPIHQEDKEGFLKLVPNAHLLLKESRGYPGAWLLLLRFFHNAKRFFHFVFRTLSRRRNSNNLKYSICSGWLGSVMPPNLSWTKHIESICSQYKFDIIQVEMPQMVSQVLCLPSESLRIHIHHELGFVRRQLEAQRFDCVDSYIEACRHFADLNEINQLNMYDMVVTLSVDDSAKLRRQGVQIPVRDSFAMVDTDVQYLFAQRDGNTLSFVGGDSHSPNYSAVMWFLSNCWAALKKKKPDCKLVVIGKWSQNNVREITERYNDVEFIGFVDDLKKAMSGSIMIVPIQVGSGIRMKILEACSMSIPFISTTVGAEGIPVKSGEHCFIADTPGEFVSKIIELEDSRLQEVFTRNAYDMVKDHYSLKSLRENRLQIYKELLSLR